MRKIIECLRMVLWRKLSEKLDELLRCVKGIFDWVSTRDTAEFKAVGRSAKK